MVAVVNVNREWDQNNTDHRAPDGRSPSTAVEHNHVFIMTESNLPQVQPNKHWTPQTKRHWLHALQVFDLRIKTSVR